MELVFVIASLILAAVFGVSGIMKIADQAGTRSSLRAFGAPGVTVRSLAIGLPVAELLVAGAILVPSSRVVGFLSAIALLMIFSIVTLFSIAQGRSFDCRCFGQLRPSEIGWHTLGRNASLLAIAVSLAAIHATGALTGGLLTGSVGAGFILIGLIGAAGFEFIPGFRKQTRRTPPFEPAFAPAGSVSRPINGTPLEPLATIAPARSIAGGGRIAPAFSLPDISGTNRSLADLLDSGLPIVLLFIDPECDLCESVLAEVKSWGQNPDLHATIQVIGCGTIEEHHEKAQAFEIRSILVQDDWEVADAYGVEGIPSAVLVNADGTIGGEFAESPANIQLLMSTLAQASPR